MRCTLATLALAALAAANPVPQGVTSAISPSSSAPAGCSPDYSGTFQIQVEKASSKRSISKRQDTALEITLSGGILTDSQGRTGYIAANNQFQFDKPPQTGAIYTAGFSICANGSLAIGGDAMWYECLSGTFYNLYDDNSAAQCSPIYIVAIGGGAAVTTAGVTTQADGQPTAASAVTQITDGQIQAPTPCTEYVDGQPQCTTAAAPVTQITDGQIQAPTTTAAVCTEYVDGQPQCTTAAAPVTQITDGQIQAPTATAAVCTEYVDGQPQCTTAAAPVTQITDGQIQAPTTTGAVVTQITDGQIQAPTPCTEYVDGQPQCAPATTVSPCTEYVDGQPQCATSTGVVPTYGSNTTVATPTVSVIPATGAGANVNSLGNQVVGLIAGVLAVVML